MNNFKETAISYRTPAVLKEEPLSFEEKISNFRKTIPGPIRRILGLLLFVPVHVVSFVLAVVMAPFVWILYGEVDRHCAKFTGPAHGYYTTGPLLSGTNVLFYDDDVYRDVRLRKRTKYVYSGGCAY